MTVVTIDEAHGDLSRLLDRVEAGEEIVLARGDRPVARLVPIERRVPRREFGSMRGIIVVGAAFFEPLPAEELASWQ